MSFFLITLSAFVGMEFVSYLVHRFVYHGFLWVIHKSHHSRREGAFELNDVFPVVFAAIAIPLMVGGVSDPDAVTMLGISIGMTLYGAVYFFIHDLYVHRRVKRFRLHLPFLLTIKKAHAIHHRYGGEPYGLLFFVRPKSLSTITITEDEQV